MVTTPFLPIGACNGLEEGVFASQKDLRPISTKALLAKAGLSHDTLQQQLYRLAACDLIQRKNGGNQYGKT